jgi:hypothetical protein
MLGQVFDLLDMPGSYLRGALAGQLGDRLGGRELLEQYGVVGKNQEGLDTGDVAGFAADVVLDPLNLIPAGLFTKAVKGALPGVRKAVAAAKAEEAGFHSLDDVVRALKAASGETVYRGQLVPSETYGDLGRALNVAPFEKANNATRAILQSRLNRAHDVAFDLERDVADLDAKLASAISPGHSVSNWMSLRGRRDVANNSLIAQRETIAHLQSKLDHVERIPKIAERNSDIVYTTPERAIANEYASQYARYPDRAAQIPGYEPTVYTLRAKPDKPWDITQYGERMSDEELADSIVNAGLSDDVADKLLERIPLRGDPAFFRPYELLRGDALSILRDPLQAAGYDAVRYGEHGTDVLALLDRSKAALQSEVDAAGRLPGTEGVSTLSDLLNAIAPRPNPYYPASLLGMMGVYNAGKLY